ncbi:MULTISPECIES: thioesterase II family protein [Streptomyces]|uniref:thioesterase II family protein n=1 Tax=Streptomyces TaxID=1883 RepID=UPI001E5900A1|nr:MULTISPECIES: alpha/beta fold hydrolase [Streptomyces]UFQ18052.1 alpha/beta fold hydrolase [Streptomyces huasconensis]WCL87663.1 alpha/beta fold hydrolase [Streptomyces sp. JCM 35825]
MGDWIRCFHPAPDAGVRLLCFPHAGGSVVAYHGLSAAVSGRVEPLMVQYPGRQDRFGEPFAAGADEIVDAVLDELPRGPGEAPLALFGHSMGALLAFETARRLEREGEPPVALVLSGRAAPSLPRRTAATRPVRDMDDAELVEEMRKLSGTADELLSSPELLSIFLPPMRADYQIVDDYVYRAGPPLSCPIAVLTGDDDPRVAPEEARAWESETRGGFSCHVLAGGHFFLDGHLPYVADVIAATLPGREAMTAP